MQRGLLLALGLVGSACAPGTAPMSATQASDLLMRFAAGDASSDLCTPSGRAQLRGAVRSYGEAMTQAGETWPQAPGVGVDADFLTALDVSVLSALASGLVEASDLPGAAREMATQALAQTPAFGLMREAAGAACEQMATLNHAAARFVLESARADQLAARGEASARAERQGRLAARARVEMETAAALAEAELEARSLAALTLRDRHESL